LFDSSRFADFSAAAIRVVDCSQSDEERLPVSPAKLKKPADSGRHPTRRRTFRFSPIKFFLTKIPLPSAIDSTERACGRRPCR
jgi:hypothetical protein